MTVSNGDLRRFHRERTRVEVEYVGEPNLDSGVAHQIKPM
jgi:hypothetical protein